jgi:hypothetical protein
MANVAVPLDECGVGLDDFERVCACWSGHGDMDGGVIRGRDGEVVNVVNEANVVSWSDGISVSSVPGRGADLYAGAW